MKRRRESIVTLFSRLAATFCLYPYFYFLPMAANIESFKILFELPAYSVSFASTTGLLTSLFLLPRSSLASPIPARAAITDLIWVVSLVNHFTHYDCMHACMHACLSQSTLLAAFEPLNIDCMQTYLFDVYQTGSFTSSFLFV